MTTNRSKDIYDLQVRIADLLVYEFCEMTETEFSGWVGNRPLEIAYISDYYVSYNDICHCIRENFDFSLLIEYHCELEAGETEKNFNHWLNLKKIEK